MSKHLFICCLILCQVLILYGQTDRQEIYINQNFHDSSFSQFVKETGAEYDIQFYFFSGWTVDLKVVQNKYPTTLDSILFKTFENTDYKYFIHSENQVIITLGNKIQSKFQEVDSIELITVAAESVNARTGGPAIEKQLENFETNWVIIGDPTSPEQKPQVTLNGYVNDATTGEPLEGALIYVEELKNGTTTDSLGYYQFSMRQGRYQILFQSIGLKDATRKVQLFASGQMDILMGALVFNIEEVVVRADRKENVSGVQMGVEALEIETIRELPALLGEVDIIRSALMLPGVQTAGEFSSGINVRGGGADQNLILLNGAPVFNASHLFGFSSSFSPDVVDGFELYKSSIPVKYGGRISSVLEVAMKEGDKEKVVVKGGISPVTSRVTVEGPVNDRTSVIVSGRSTYSDWVLRRIENASFRNSSANYSDVTARLKTTFGQNDHLDISSYFSNDDFQLNGDTTFAYQNFNFTANYQHEFGEKLFATFSGVYSQYKFNVNSKEMPATAFDLSYKIKYTEGRTHFSYAPNEKHQVNFGLNLIHYGLSPGRIKPFSTESIISPQELSKERALEGSLYVSDEWTLSDKFSIYAGLRYTQYLFLGPQTVFNYKEDAARIENNIIGSTQYDKGEIVQSYSGPEYRTSLRYSFDTNSSVKLAFNRNRQYLSMLFNSATVSPTATWKLSDKHISPQTGDQVSLGFYQNMFNDRLEFSIEGYYKRIQDMVDYKAGAQLLLNDHLETDVLNGEGRAFGIEILLKKNGRKLNGWMSYTFSRTRFRADSPFVQDRINRGEWFPTNFDKPHDFSFVGYYKVSKRFSLSSNFAYSTGRPITIPVAKYNFGGGVRLQYSQRNEFRVPDYFRWDLSINIEGNHKKKKLAHNSWSLSIYNVTGRNNVYSIYFVSDGSNAQGYKLSIFGRPIITLTYNFRI